MLLKLCGNEDKADDNTSKECRIVSNVIEARYFINKSNEAMLDVQYSQPNKGSTEETFLLLGNAYLMTDNGKTVQAFAASPYGDA